MIKHIPAGGEIFSAYEEEEEESREMALSHSANIWGGGVGLG